VLEHLVHKELPLAVRVARVDDAPLCRLEKLPDGGKLRFCAAVRLSDHLPRFRKDREILHAPGLLAVFERRDALRQISVGLGLREEMTEAPGNDRAAAADDEGLLPSFNADSFGDRAREARFFGDVERIDVGQRCSSPNRNYCSIGRSAMDSSEASQMKRSSHMMQDFRYSLILSLVFILNFRFGFFAKVLEKLIISPMHTLN